MTNAQKHSSILVEAEFLQTKLLSEFLVGKTVPKELYSNSANAGVTTWTVESVAMIGVLWPMKKPSSADLATADAKLATLKGATQADPMNVVLHLREANTARQVTTGLPWARLTDHTYGYFSDKAEAEAANKQWHADHDARPDHFMCDYCRKQFPDAQKLRATIWRNGGQEVRQFCTSEHASYDQFASEG